MLEGQGDQKAGSARLVVRDTLFGLRDNPAKAARSSMASCGGYGTTNASRSP